jgi:hypothetical protein
MGRRAEKEMGEKRVGDGKGRGGTGRVGTGTQRGENLGGGGVNKDALSKI